MGFDDVEAGKVPVRLIHLDVGTAIGYWISFLSLRRCLWHRASAVVPKSEHVCSSEHI